MANPPPMLPGLGFPVDSEIDLLRKWTWNTWLWAQEDFEPSDIPGLALWYSASSPAFDAYTYGQAIPTLFDRSGNGWNATQSTGTAQARFLTHDGRNYLRGSGVTGNNATCDGVTNVGSFGVRAMYAPATSWASGSPQRIQRQANGPSQRKYGFQISATGFLTLALYNNAQNATVYNSTATVPFTSNNIGYVGAFWDQSAGQIIFETSTDGITWSQLGSVVSASTSNNGAAVAYPICVLGNLDPALSDATAGRLFWTTYSLTRGGAPIRYFDASRGNFNSATIGSATGETWTINRTGLDPAMIVSARAFLPLTDDYYDIAAGAAGVLQNVGGGTIIWASSAAGASNTGMAISGGTSATENRMASSANPAATTLSVGGRRLDSDSLVTNAVAGQQAAYGFAVQAGRLNYASALSAVFKNGYMVGTESAFQTAGNTSNTASLRMRVFANVTEVVDGFASGPTTDLLLYNRALTNAEIFKLSDWMAEQAGIA